MDVPIDLKEQCLYYKRMAKYLLCSSCLKMHPMSSRVNGECPSCEGIWFVRVGDPGHHLRCSLGDGNADVIMINRTKGHEPVPKRSHQ